MRTKYATPVPTTTIFTEEDCSRTYSEVIKLQQEYGFDYAGAVGSLMYLMNTYIKLNYATRKLARTLHAISWPKTFQDSITSITAPTMLQKKRRNQVLFESVRISITPLYDITRKQNTHVVTNHMFHRRTFHDCPDTSRSTGGYLILVQGGVVDVTSTMPQLIAYSTCEAEYCTGALATMVTTYIKKIYNELHGFDSDRSITIPIGMDSQSAIYIAQSNKEHNEQSIFNDDSTFFALQWQIHKLFYSKLMAPATVPSHSPNHLVLPTCHRNQLIRCGSRFHKPSSL
jgi:hypothetical protein